MHGHVNSRLVLILPLLTGFAGFVAVEELAEVEAEFEFTDRDSGFAHFFEAEEFFVFEGVGGRVAGYGYPFSDVVGVGEAAVDGAEGVAEEAEEDAAGAFSAADGDIDFAIFGVGFDAGDVVGFVAFAVGEEDAAAPEGLFVKPIVGEDDEAGHDAGGEDAVVVLEFEGVALLLTWELGIVGFFFGEETGEEEAGLGAVGQVEAKLEFFH